MRMPLSRLPALAAILEAQRLPYDEIVEVTPSIEDLFVSALETGAAAQPPESRP